MNAGCGFACTVHANSARDALQALVSAAVMAGEQVPESALRAVFAGALDLVVHCDLRDCGRDGLRRQVTEIIGVVPSLHDDFSTETIFTRERPDGALRWTGTLPPGFERLGRRLPQGWSFRGICSGEETPL